MEDEAEWGEATVRKEERGGLGQAGNRMDKRKKECEQG
jgi:hypothetical protein